MRMGYDDGMDAAKICDRFDRVFIDIGDTIPQYIALFCATQNSTLTNCNLWLRIYTDQSRVILVVCKHITKLAGALQLSESRPCLPAASVTSHISNANASCRTHPSGGTYCRGSSQTTHDLIALVECWAPHMPHTMRSILEMRYQVLEEPFPGARKCQEHGKRT